MSWSIEGKVVVITGANTGIGLAAGKALAARGAHIILTSRDPEKGAAALDAVRAAGGSTAEVMALDLASFASIEAFAAALLKRHPRIDVLINNAGLVLSQRSQTAEGFETTFGVNHLGHFLLTDLLRERLIASAPARIINVSSDAHKAAPNGLDFDDLQSEKGYSSIGAYGRSKLANILFTRELARRLEGTGVTVNALHPGVVSTRFGQDGDAAWWLRWFYAVGKPFLRTPEKGAETTVHLAVSPELQAISGRYFKNSREATPAPAGRDDAAAARLWAASEALVAAARAHA